MTSSNEKIEQQDSLMDEKEAKGNAELEQDEGRCVSRWPLVLSILAVLVAAVFAFGLSSNIVGVDRMLNQEVETIRALQAKVEQLESSMQQPDISTVVRNELNHAALDDVLQRVGALVKNVGNPELAKKLEEIGVQLQEVKKSLPAATASGS